MRALWFQTTGGPEVLELVEIARPVPGPGRVLVRNHALGVNYADTMFRRGTMPSKHPIALPFIPGQEGAGVVVALGADVEGPAVGTRVLWADIPAEVDGYAEYSSVRADFVVPIPDSVGFEDAAAAPLVYATARNQIFNYDGRAAPGDWVLIRAAAGGAGTAMVDTALAAGLRVIAVTRGEKLGFARARGATATIDYTRETVPERVRAITGGAGVALALNPVSGKTVVEDLGLLAPCGHLILYGLITGLPTGNVFGDWMRRVGEGLSISVASIDAYMRHNPRGFHDLLVDVAADLAAGRIKPPISQAFSLRDGARAHALIDSGTTTGKLILTVDPS